MIQKDLKKNWFVYLLAVPVVAWFLIFCYGPMWGVLIAFKDFKPLLGFSESDWVGFKHFIDFFQGPYFWRVVKNTLLLNVWGIAFGFTAPIILALMLNEIRGAKFKKTVQTITYMPHFISLVVVCGIIHIFAADEGIITQILQFITGKEYSSLLGYSSFFRPIYTFSGIWQSIGWDSIIYLAAMSSIDTSLYEAAEIDGVGRIKKMWHITLPQISPVIIILFIFAIGGLMSSGYEKIILLYNPLIYDTADVIASYVYRRGLREASLSYSTAVGLISSIVNFGLLWMTNRIAKRRSEVSLW
ncbi:ABC transporter permease subunit [Paenibacillus sp. FSL L8-0436]|jgi:putative aldouronate transport system permease protein|uniref:ABC transporter permease n=1 Tax=Paenibacillus sp. FSL L8-0436 TaxID=2954686 RepID=UPI00315857FE